MSALIAAMAVELVGRFGVGKRRVEFLLPFRIVGERDARLRRAHGLQVEHVAGQIDHGLLRPLPFAATQVRPPMWASVGRLFAPPTYFCTRSILEAGT